MNIYVYIYIYIYTCIYIYIYLVWADHTPHDIEMIVIGPKRLRKKR